MDQSWDFPVPPGELWNVLSRTQDYRTWFSWLRSIDASDGRAQGATARCVIGPPVPYLLRVTIRVVALVPGRTIATEVDGDLRGPARLEIEEAEAGSRARLVWALTVSRPVLQVAARLARPLMQRGHDWCVDTGVAQFRRKAIAPEPRGT